MNFSIHHSWSTVVFTIFVYVEDSRFLYCGTSYECLHVYDVIVLTNLDGGEKVIKPFLSLTTQAMRWIKNIIQVKMRSNVYVHCNSSSSFCETRMIIIIWLCLLWVAANEREENKNEVFGHCSHENRTSHLADGVFKVFTSFWMKRSLEFGSSIAIIFYAHLCQIIQMNKICWMKIKIIRSVLQRRA